MSQVSQENDYVVCKNIYLDFIGSQNMSYGIRF